MPLFRCTNEDCSEADIDRPPALDFEAVLPVCPKCKADGRKNPNKVVPLATIHYLVATDDGPIRTPNGNRLIACLPAQRKLPKHATATAEAANCPACRESQVYKDHVAAGVDQDQDIMQFRPM